jgi:hypothetical protein
MLSAILSGKFKLRPDGLSRNRASSGNKAGLFLSYSAAIIYSILA